MEVDEMFEQLVESSSLKRQGRRWSYFAVTSAVWVLVTSAVIVGGVAGYDGRLNDQFEMLTMVLPSPPLAPLPSGPPVKRQATTQLQPATFTSQQHAPREIPQPSNLPPTDMSVIAGSGTGPGVPGGDPNGVPEGVLHGVPGVPPGGTSVIGEPPPPPPTPKKEEAPVVRTARRTSTILQGTAIRRVEPPFPRIAIVAGVSGSVVVEVLVDEKGVVVSARALSGHVLLRSAAESAARGWRWNPTVLNDVPIQVVGTITFNFVR
jgi:TonB family protein